MDLIRFVRDQCMSSSSPSFPIPAENLASLSLSISLSLSVRLSLKQAFGTRFWYMIRFRRGSKKGKWRKLCAKQVRKNRGENV